MRVVAALELDEPLVVRPVGLAHTRLVVIGREVVGVRALGHIGRQRVERLARPGNAGLGVRWVAPRRDQQEIEAGLAVRVGGARRIDARDRAVEILEHERAQVGWRPFKGGDHHRDRLVGELREESGRPVVERPLGEQPVHARVDRRVRDARDHVGDRRAEVAQRARLCLGALRVLPAVADRDAAELRARPLPRVEERGLGAELAPVGVESRKGGAARSGPAPRTPACARTVWRTGSTWIPFIRDRSTISPPSVTALPATLCPPPRTEISSPSSRPKLTASTTSAVCRQRAIRRGRLSMRPLWMRRASSYPASSGARISPENTALRASADGVPRSGMRPRNRPTAAAEILAITTVWV